VAPLGYTATWGDRTAQPVLSVGSIGVGVNDYNLAIAKTAPATPGIYYLPIAFSYELTIDQVMSATWWNYPGSPIWNDGNDIGWDWSPAQYSHALQYGWETQEVLGAIAQDAVGQNGNYTILNQPATWVEIQVVPAQSRTNLVESLGINLIVTSQGVAITNRNEVIDIAAVAIFQTRDAINLLGAATTNNFSSAAQLLRVTPILNGANGPTRTVVKDGTNVVDVSGFFLFSTEGSVESRSATLGGQTLDAKRFSIRKLALQDQLLYPALGAHFAVQGFDVSTLCPVALSDGLVVNAHQAVWTVNGTGDYHSKPLVIQGQITVNFAEVDVAGETYNWPGGRPSTQQP
jgi:hypothetical protein